MIFAEAIKPWYDIDWTGLAQSVWAVVPDIVQIAILYFAIYAILKAARGSRFGQVLMGVGILFALLIAFTFLFNFDVLARIVQMLLFYLALSSVVIFQPEIRRILASLGSLLFQDQQRNLTAHGTLTPERIVDIVFKLAKSRTGALIAFERAISLRGYESTGVQLDALVSPELFFAVFTEPMPLHDGGVVMRNGRLAAAHCLFPVSNKSDLSASGMRHRAAVGLSEETDALIVVVSEETGRVSIAHNGRLIRYPDAQETSRKAVLRWISKAMPRRRSSFEEINGWLGRYRARFTHAAAPQDANATEGSPA